MCKKLNIRDFAEDELISFREVAKLQHVNSEWLIRMCQILPFTHKVYLEEIRFSRKGSFGWHAKKTVDLAFGLKPSELLARLKAR